MVPLDPERPSTCPSCELLVTEDEDCYDCLCGARYHLECIDLRGCLRLDCRMLGLKPKRSSSWRRERGSKRFNAILNVLGAGYFLYICWCGDRDWADMSLKLVLGAVVFVSLSLSLRLYASLSTRARHEQAKRRRNRAG